MVNKFYNESPIQVPRFEESKGFYTSKKRSKIMSKIKGKNSKPELILRKALWNKKIRYRIHQKKLPGSPDIVIQRYKLAIFVDGEFWHGYDWENVKSRIKSNQAFWIPKIERNMQKDYFNNKALRDLGYTVFRFWSNEVIKDLKKVLNQIDLFIETRSLYP